MLSHIDDLLRARGAYAPAEPRIPWRARVGVDVCGMVAYGSALGAFGGRPLQSIYSALKLPILLCGTTLLCLPSFFVLNAVLGLRDDFASACRGILAGQATLAVTLAACAPLTLFWYAGTDHYASATWFNGAICFLATLAGQVTVARHYRPLRLRHPRHLIAQRAWMALYIFIAIQMAWMLRPFLGSPGLETRFIRAEEWNNAYVEIFNRLF